MLSWHRCIPKDISHRKSKLGLVTEWNDEKGKPTNLKLRLIKMPNAVWIIRKSSVIIGSEWGGRFMTSPHLVSSKTQLSACCGFLAVVGWHSAPAVCATVAHRWRRASWRVQCLQTPIQSWRSHHWSSMPAETHTHTQYRISQLVYQRFFSSFFFSFIDPQHITCTRQKKKMHLVPFLVKQLIYWTKVNW